MSPRGLDRAVVQRRLEQIGLLLDDLASVDVLTAEQLESDRMLRHAIERIMTQLVELATAINSHIAVATFGAAPEDYHESFLRCADAGAIPATLAGRLAPSAGLRNILVHAYIEIDLSIVASSVASALTGFTEYRRAIASWLSTH
jgi:uncharacterized protein YutE (UPF0331/DUF86 family)